MKRAAEARLTEGGIGKIIIRMAVPMAVALLGRVAFNLVDAFFVGRLGTEELAAISFTFPVVLIVTSISLGLGIGASATISRAIGERDHHRIKRLTTDALILSFLIVLGVAITGLLTIDPLFRLLGVPPSLLPLVRQYMTIWYCGVPEVISTASLYLRIVGISYAFFGLLRLSVSALNALNKPLQSAMLSILRLFALYIPLAYLGSQLFALKGIFGGAALANVLAGVIAFFWLKKALSYIKETGAVKA